MTGLPSALISLLSILLHLRGKDRVTRHSSATGHTTKETSACCLWSGGGRAEVRVDVALHKEQRVNLDYQEL